MPTIRIEGFAAVIDGQRLTYSWGETSWPGPGEPRRAPLKRRRRLLGRLRGRALLAFAAYLTGRGPWPGAARLGL